MIQTAGAVITNPCGSVMRSLLVAVCELGVEDIMVIGHHGCGMCGMRADRLLAKMAERSIREEAIDTLRASGVDVNAWLSGFHHVEDAVRETVRVIRQHPLMPTDVRVHGFVIDPETGKLDALMP